uniref:Uncharacterized protein n=1 Tax=Periophthalmus magnuspinnatus TaxID=409849 RepID=A0A3B4ATG1_9GOBI
MKKHTFIHTGLSQPFSHCKHNSYLMMPVLLQVRNHMCVKCVVKGLARAPTSSPTAESTAATGHSTALTVSSASSAGWTYSATRRSCLSRKKPGNKKHNICICQQNN